MSGLHGNPQSRLYKQHHIDKAARDLHHARIETYYGHTEEHA